MTTEAAYNERVASAQAAEKIAELERLNQGLHEALEQASRQVARLEHRVQEAETRLDQTEKIFRIVGEAD